MIKLLRRSPARLLSAGAIVAAIALVALVVLGGEDDGPPGLAPTATPLLPTAAATPGPRLIYSTAMELRDGGDGTLLSRRVIAYDTASKTNHTILEYAESSSYWIQEVLLDGKLFYATAGGIMRLDLDDLDKTTTIYTPPDGSTVIEFAVSPDASMLAIILRGEGMFESELIITELGGRELLRLSDADPRLDAFFGDFWELVWRDDSRGVVMPGATASELPGGLATVFIDGTFRVHDIQAHESISPTGRQVAYVNPEDLCQLTIAHHAIKIRDLDSGEETVVVDDVTRTKLYTPWAWAPDGSELLYVSGDYGGTPGDCSLEEAWFIWTNDASVPVASPEEAAERWYGTDLVIFDCDRYRRPVLPGRWLDRYDRCYSHGTLGELTIGDDLVGEFEEVRVLGVIGP